MSGDKPLALTLGEPAGIGPDIALAAWARRKELALPPFYVVGDRGASSTVAPACSGSTFRLAAVAPARALETFADALPVVESGMTATARARQAR